MFALTAGTATRMLVLSLRLGKGFRTLSRTSPTFVPRCKRVVRSGRISAGLQTTSSSPPAFCHSSAKCCAFCHCLALAKQRSAAATNNVSRRSLSLSTWLRSCKTAWVERNRWNTTACVLYRSTACVTNERLAYLPVSLKLFQGHISFRRLDSLSFANGNVPTCSKVAFRHISPTSTPTTNK